MCECLSVWIRQWPSFCKVLDKVGLSVGYYGATGSMIRNMVCCNNLHKKHSRILNYIFIVKAGAEMYSIFEFIQSMHHVKAITEGLNIVKDNIEVNTGKPISEIFTGIVIDFSATLQKAICSRVQMRQFIYFLFSSLGDV